MRDSKKPKAPKQSEDKTFGRVVGRLIASAGVSYGQISAWMKEQGVDFPFNSICDLTHGKFTNYPHRIMLLKKYFQEVHGFDYVTADYLLEGDERDKEFVRREKEVQQIIAAQSAKQLPLEEYANQESA